MNVEEIDLKTAYMHHRMRVKCAKAIVDDKAPIMSTVTFARLSQMKEDVKTENDRHRSNMRILAAINKVLRTKGEIDTFRTRENSFTPAYSKLPQKIVLLDKLDMENIKIGKKILRVKPELDTWLHDRFKRKRDSNKSSEFQYPTMVMDKYSNIEIPKNPSQLSMFFRPKVWFNLEVKDVRPLGRILIELYTEAAPQVVLEFIRLCCTKQKDRIKFIRLFSHLWLEGELLLENNTLIRKNIEYDKRALDHGQHVGVLSFHRKIVKNLLTTIHPVLNFTISFKPLRVCNGRRIGFGRVCGGLRVLNCIEDFGTKNGKPSKEIIVANCGMLL